MKISQVIEYSKILFFFKNRAENKARRLVPDFFLFYVKNFYLVKGSVLQLSFIYILIARNFAYNKNKQCKVHTTDLEICST